MRETGDRNCKEKGKSKKEKGRIFTESITLGPKCLLSAPKKIPHILKSILQVRKRILHVLKWILQVRK